MSDKASRLDYNQKQGDVVWKQNELSVDGGIRDSLLGFPLLRCKPWVLLQAEGPDGDMIDDLLTQ